MTYMGRLITLSLITHHTQQLNQTTLCTSYLEKHFIVLFQKYIYTLHTLIHLSSGPLCNPVHYRAQLDVLRFILYVMIMPFRNLLTKVATLTLLFISITCNIYLFQYIFHFYEERNSRTELSQVTIGNVTSDQQVSTTTKKKSSRRIQNLVQLNSVNNTLFPYHITACCGIGHRLTFILPSIVYAIRKNRASKIVLEDVPWSVLFKNTAHVQSEIKNKNFTKAEDLGLLAKNHHPEEYWRERPRRTYRGTKTILDRYRYRDIFYSPMLIAVIHQLQEAMTPLVLSYFESIREQLNPERIYDHVHGKEVSLCFHLRQGNNETGDWQEKTWRHVNADLVLNTTLSDMESFVESHNASKATLFIASDNADTRP